MKLIRTLIAYVSTLFFFLILNLLFPFYLIFKLIGLEEASLRFNFSIMRIGVKIILFLAGIKVFITGKSNISKKKKIVIVANHIAAMDPIFFIYAFPNPFTIISKSSLLRIPIINLMLIGVGAIFVNRRSIKSSANASKKAINVINNGGAIGVFPEGTRNRGGETKEFKKGSFKIALESNADIIPVTFLNTDKFFINNFIFNSGLTVYMHIHPEINVSKLTNEEKSNLYITIREEIVEKLEEMKIKYNDN